MSKIPHQAEITSLMEEARLSLNESPPSLIEFKNLVEFVRDISRKNNDRELLFLNFVLDGVLDQVMRHVAGHASTLVNKDDAMAIVQGLGNDLSLVLKSLKETDLNMLHTSYVSLVANYTDKIKKIRVEIK